MRASKFLLIASLPFLLGTFVLLGAGSDKSGTAAHPNTIFRAIRTGDLDALTASLNDRSFVNARDEEGNTPLIAAAFYSDAVALEKLLDAGADVNATNKAGATALMRAVSDLTKVKTLLKHGANPNSISANRNTALIIAAQQYDSVSVLKELLEHKAEVCVKNQQGDDALLAAVRTGNCEAAALLLAQGADVNAARSDHSARTPALSALMTAALYGHLDCVKLLLARGADVRFTSELGNALHFAAFADRRDIARLLIERGVDVNATGNRLLSNRRDTGLTPLIYASMTERNDASLVRLLLEHGADANARASSGDSPLRQARKRGATAVAAALRAAGAKDHDDSTPAVRGQPMWVSVGGERIDSGQIRKSVETALSALLKSGTQFTEETGNRCFSCHQQSHPALAFGLAKEKGFRYDNAAFEAQVNAAVRAAARRKSSVWEEPLPVPSISAWFLIGLHAADYPGDELTDAYAHSLERSQYGDGRWITPAARAPMDYSDVTSTALSLWALKLYAPPTMKAVFEKRVGKAVEWLSQCSTVAIEERSLQLLGLYWANADSSRSRTLVANLLKEQREDGGWAQLPTLPSDAYATGLALYALAASGGVQSSDPSYQNGMRFLLKKQLDDGSWHVATRASPVQVAIDGVFSHGEDQWISAAATTWASMALMLGCDRAQ